jgi:hypothetical protein
MDETFLREQAVRCRSLADKADEFTKKRLLDLAARYESRLPDRPSKASRVIRLLQELQDAPSPQRVDTPPPSPIVHSNSATSGAFNPRSRVDTSPQHAVR